MDSATYHMHNASIGTGNLLRLIETDRLNFPFRDEDKHPTKLRGVHDDWPTLQLNIA